MVPFPLTYVAGASLVGQTPSGGSAWTPAVSAGWIWSGNEMESPTGPLTQIEAGRQDVKLSAGFALTTEYVAYGSKGKLDVFPLFGPTLGAALKVMAIRDFTLASERWWVGPELQPPFYRFRGQFAVKAFGPPGSNRFPANLGVGF